MRVFLNRKIEKLTYKKYQLTCNGFERPDSSGGSFKSIDGQIAGALHLGGGFVCPTGTNPKPVALSELSVFVSVSFDVEFPPSFWSTIELADALSHLENKTFCFGPERGCVILFTKPKSKQNNLWDLFSVTS